LCGSSSGPGSRRRRPRSAQRLPLPRPRCRCRLRTSDAAPSSVRGRRELEQNVQNRLTHSTAPSQAPLRAPCAQVGGLCEPSDGPPCSVPRRSELSVRELDTAGRAGSRGDLDSGASRLRPGPDDLHSVSAIIRPPSIGDYVVEHDSKPTFPIPWTDARESSLAQHASPKTGHDGATCAAHDALRLVELLRRTSMAGSG
jgi:hypothetical protein